MIDTKDHRRRRLKRSDLLHCVSGHPGCTVAEAPAALADPASTAATNREPLHDLYRADWPDLGHAPGGKTPLAARRSPDDGDRPPAPSWSLPAPPAGVDVNVEDLPGEARQAPVGAAGHLLRRIRRNLAGERMTDIYAGRLLVAAAKTLGLEAVE